jgi:hypothetical protein
MKLTQLRDYAKDKTNYQTITNYITFAQRYLDFISDKRNFQAEILSRNESHYQFIQYKQDGHLNVTRPLNSNLLYSSADFQKAAKTFLALVKHAKGYKPKQAEREIINRVIYTAQQSIGASLDALPAGQSNTARKVNGDLFERFIRLIVNELGIDCTSGTINIPVCLDGEKEPAFGMSYQHDLILKSGEFVKAIGSVKTSSKDRLDKVFIDKFLFNRLTGKDVPHVAIFLNDVQRTGTIPKFGIGATFLPGHFKGYTVKLNPLDGVYYCDIRPNMQTEPILKDHIRTFDHFVFTDVWDLMNRDAIIARVEESENSE